MTSARSRFSQWRRTAKNKVWRSLLGALPKYEYSSLSNNDIRLITLDPGIFDDLICCSISHTPLLVPPARPQPERLTLLQLQRTLPGGWEAWENAEGCYFFGGPDANEIQYHHPDPRIRSEQYENLAHYPPPEYRPNYDALSYVWGPQDNLESAYIWTPDGSARMLKIGPNLISALRHLRYRDKPRVLWVDAICINQEDESERNEQVPRMREIYSFASQVIAWLGSAGRDSGITIDRLCRLGQWSESATDGHTVRRPGPEDEYHSRHEQTSDSAHDTAKSLRAIIHLLDREYFHRVWIVQEVRLGQRNTTFQCGEDTISLRDLRQALAYMVNSETQWPEAARQVASRAHNLVAGSSDTNPVDVLVGARGRACTRPHDRVFGVLSLLSPAFANLITVEYSKEAHKVYEEALWASVEVTQRLDMLVCCNSGSGESTSAPSWIPSLLNAPKNSIPMSSSFQAAGISRAKYNVIKATVLDVTGIKAAVISTVSDPLSNRREQSARTLSACQPDMLTGSVYPTGQSILEAYVETLRLGSIRARFPQSRKIPYSSKLEKFLVDPANDHKERSRQIDMLYGQIHLVGFSAFLQTAEGYFGFGPPAAGPGDVVAVMLGCFVPLLLRPLAEGCFRILGPCYVHGLMQGEALLGQLSEPWHLRYQGWRSSLHQEYHNTVTKSSQKDDPRLPALPSEWEQLDVERTPDDPYNVAHFRNRNTGEVMNSDPRLLPQALKERGIELQDFRLV